MKIYRTLAFVGVVAAGLAFTATPANADEVPSSTGIVEVDGRQFGPEDGVSVTTESFELEPGTGKVVGVDYGTTPTKGQFSPQATWGSSYATSTEYAQYFYRGAAKAAGNVYAGQRIIKVCIQYTRSGSPVADKRCSSASSNGGSWAAGAETLSYATDSLSLSGPRTVFNIETTRVSPNIV